MLRVRLFPGFSTAVLQTGPPTLGVRLNEPKILIYVSHVHELVCVRCNTRLILILYGRIVLWPRCKSIAPLSCSNIRFLL
jgi:hypothetical protein